MTMKNTDAPENLRPLEAAHYLGVSVSMLNKLRMKRTRHNGPKFAKICGCVVYRRADLDDWLARNLVQSV